MAGARLKKEAFYCRALSGESSYNISVNSDMTLSCNCTDFDRSAVLGDLSRDSLPDILHGPTAQRFRNQLAKGVLPLARCPGCCDLRRVSREQAEHHRIHFEMPRKGIMIENTIRCNLRCIGCYQNVTARERDKKSLTLEDLKMLSRMVREHRIERVSYFKLGEPFLSPTLHEELAILRAGNPQLTISMASNGMLINSDRQREAAMLLDELVVSLDGMDQATVSRYQKGSDFDRVYQNLCDLIACRNLRGKTTPVIEWKYVLFNWNDRSQMIYRAIELARDAQVDILSFCPTRTPLHGISWRYYLGRFFSTIGQPSWKGREIRFDPAKQPAALLQN